MKRLSNAGFLLLALTVLLYSCGFNEPKYRVEPACNLSPDSVAPKYSLAPYTITSTKAVPGMPCAYPATINLSFLNSPAKGTGYVQVQNNTLSLCIQDSSTLCLDFIKFLPKGSHYQFKLQYQKHNISSTVLIEQVLPYLKDSIYLCRFKKVMPDFDESIDAVFICTKKQGVVGQYYSIIKPNEELLLSPKGNLLKNVISYKDKRHTRLCLTAKEDPTMQIML